MKTRLKKGRLIYIGVVLWFMTFVLSIKPSIPEKIPALRNILTPSVTNTFVDPQQLSSRLKTPSPEIIQTFTPALALQATQSECLLPTQSIDLCSNTQPTQVLYVYFIDVGQGDSILIQSSRGETILIDGGDENQAALNYLLSLGITKLDIVIASHVHPDHIGGLIEVLNTIPVAKVYSNGEMTTTLTYESFLDAILSSNAAYFEVKRGDTITDGSLNFSVLNLPYANENNTNNNSIILRLVYQNISFLFMGDAEYEVESSLVNSGFSIKSDILKIGHHGSNTSSSATFLNFVHPSIAVYSAGLGNPFHLPDPEVLKRITGLGTLIYGTDINGTILISTDGTNYQVRTTLQSEPVTIP
jgi:competence protein ComEC